MFKDLPLQATYSSYEDNIVDQFYNPVLQYSVHYDRVSAYFSAKALAAYSKGLECFARNGNSYRLIISSDIEEDDYNEIKHGYKLKESIQKDMLKKLREEISLDDEKNISNLAYLISLGIVEIKIAFTKKGIFHDKFGVLIDKDDNIICFRGSNNETEAAIKSNYEAFDLTCSWYASDFDYKKIENCINTFDKLWRNLQDRVIVMDANEVIMNEILKYDKKRLIVDRVLLEDNCLILDYDKSLILHMRIEDVNSIIGSAFYKLRIKRHCESIVENKIYFKQALTYIDYQDIINLFKSDAEQKGYRFLVTDRLTEYINSRNLHIERRAKLGIELKRQDEKLRERFEEYSKIVNAKMSRQLREKQLWDSFFMAVMNKSGNFSVPGSGKTASVLGVYAYLKSKGIINRIVMIGPKNAFGSWIDEFNLCFGGKEELKLFNVHDTSYKSTKQRRNALKFDTGNKNLLLFNYECLPTYEEDIKSIIDDKTLLAFDEVHRVKRVEGEYAARTLEIAQKAVYTIAMTGTPIPNSYTDLYNLLHILYHDEYKDFFNFNVMTLRNPSDGERWLINERIQPFFCRTTKQQLKVPDANDDKVIYVCASKSENQLLNILCAKYRRNKLALFIRLLQLESTPQMLLKSIDINDFREVLDYSDDIDEVDFTDYSNDVVELINSIDITSKMDRCINLVRQLVSENKTVIVWCIFIDSINRIYELLAEVGIRSHCVYGEVPLEERSRIIQCFKDGEFQVLITNPHTLAESISLHGVCHDAVYFEYSYNLVHLLQSKDRIHRLGIPDDQYTQYYYLQNFFEFKENEYSLDEKTYLRLIEKERIMLQAIDNDALESVSTSEEDLDIIFGKLYSE